MISNNMTHAANSRATTTHSSSHAESDRQMSSQFHSYSSGSDLSLNELFQNLIKLIQSLLQQFGQGNPPKPEPEAPSVDLTAAQTQAVEGVTGLRDVHVSDTDNSGSLSAGDVVSSADGQQHILTAAEVKDVFAFQPPTVALDAAQLSAAETITGLSDVRIDDNDLSGTLSAGDNAVSVSTGESIILSADDVNAINSFQAPTVALDAAQLSAAEAVTGLSDVRVDDNDLSGGLSAGDEAVSVSTGESVRLTAADVDAINAFQPPSVEVTPLQNTYLERLTGLSDIRVDDNDLSGNLSAGDEVVSERTGESVRLSADDVSKINQAVDRYDAGKDTIHHPGPDMELTAEQKQGVEEVLNISDHNANVRGIYATDTDGSGSLSEGDVIIREGSGADGRHAHVLTAAEANAINNGLPRPEAPRVELTPAQTQAFSRL